MRNIFRFLCAVLLCGAVAAPASAQYLSADEIKKLFGGTTVETYIWSGTGWAPDQTLDITLNPDGTLAGEVGNRASTSDDGKWWTEKNDVFCFQWENLEGGDKQCARLALQKDGITIELSRPGGKKFEWDWTIIDPGPQAIAIIAARTGARVAAAPRTAQPPASPPAPVRPAQRALAAAQDKVPPAIDVPATIAAKGVVAVIAGRVKDSSQIVEVTINGLPIPVEPDGSFKVRRGVPTGESTITVAAVDEWGNRSARNVTVRRESAVTQRRIKAPPKPPAAPKPNPYAGIHFGAYHALVIGNNNYRDLPKLKTAVNDARAVARLLSTDYGFSTKLLIDATRADVITALARMRAKLKANDNLLIYYAGHGVIDDVTERGYWLPVDAEQAVPTNWVSNDDITAMLRAIRANHIMVVADSCYSGTLVRATSARMETARERAAWFKRIVKKRGRTALVSGGLEPVTDSGMGGHSVFAGAFLAALAENTDVIDGQTLYQAIKRPVVLNADQTPQYSDIRRAGHDGGDFLFVRKR